MGKKKKIQKSFTVNSIVNVYDHNKGHEFYIIHICIFLALNSQIDYF